MYTERLPVQPPLARQVLDNTPQLLVAARLRALARIEHDGAEEVVHAQADAEGEEEVRQRVRFDRWEGGGWRERRSVGD
jgi:hypothetical protein